VTQSVESDPDKHGDKKLMSSAQRIYSGPGSPQGVISAGAGDIYVASDGTMYLKSQGSGATGWTLLPSAASGDTTAKYLIGAADAALTNAAVWPSLFTSPDMPPAVRNAMDDEFDGASLNSPNSIWTWTNQGGSTETQSNGLANITCPANSSAATPRFIGQLLPSAPWTFVSKFSMGITGDFYEGGIILYESGTGKALSIGFQTNGGAAVAVVSLAGSGSVIYTLGSRALNPMSTGYFKVSLAGTTLTFQYSPDGVNYFLSGTGTRTITTDFTVGPDTIGLGIAPYNLGASLIADYFRRTQ
jgi:hypothetical protein